MDFFDEDGEVFIKLYKRTDDGLLYWESWNTSDKTATSHWGRLGETGSQESILAKNHFDLKEKINNTIQLKKDEGYVEIPIEDMFTVIITFKLETWGTVTDIEYREHVREIINEHLGWTGNGDCSDADIGSGTMSLYADVVNYTIAINTITNELKNKGIKKEYSFKVMKGDVLIN